MTSHYIFECTAGTQGFSSNFSVDACFPTLAEAITYCVGRTEAVYDSWEEPDLYKISEFQGSELLAEWDCRGNKTWDARYKV
jgi:hypothetical protein